MTKQVMRPYILYLPEEYIVKIKELAKERKASEIVRDAIVSALDGSGEYDSGYNKGVRDAIKIVGNCREAYETAIRGVPISDLLTDQLRQIMVHGDGK